MTALSARKRSPAVFEILLCLAVLASVGWVIRAVHADAMLPQPFIWDNQATWSDWFAPAYWANHGGAFDKWGTVYPPLSFLILKVFSIGRCYESPLLHPGLCDTLGIAALIAFYLLGGALAFACYWRVDRRTAVVRGVALAVGFPMLYTLERGNLILICFCFFVLGHGRLLKAAWARWLCIGLSINLKPYILASVLPYAARRKWRWLEGCGLATVLVYFVSVAILGQGDIVQLVKNYKNWIAYTHSDTMFWWNIYASTTYAPIVDALRRTALSPYLGSTLINLGIFVLPLAIRVGQAGVLLGIGGAWLRSTPVPTHRLAALGMCLFLTSTNPGIYTLVFLLFLVFLEKWEGPARIAALTAAYLLSLSYDIILMTVYHHESDSWVSGRRALTTYGVSVGQLVRPGLILLIEYALAVQTLSDIVRFDFGRVRAEGERGQDVPRLPSPTPS